MNRKIRIKVVNSDKASTYFTLNIKYESIENKLAYMKMYVEESSEYLEIDSEELKKANQNMKNKLPKRITFY